MVETADILVIGGGIAGVGAAAMASHDARVIVLEMEERPAYHTTGRSAATFIISYGPPAVRALTRASEATLASPPDWLADGAILSPRGLLLVAHEGQEEAFEAELGEAGDMVEITPEEAVERFPILRRDRIVRACFDPTARDIDVDRLFQGFARALRRNGGRIEVKAEAVAITHPGPWRVETPSGAFEAPVLINAAGAWADVVAERAGIAPLGFIPCRRSAAIIPAPEGRDTSQWPLAADAAETWYARPDAGRLLVSPADQDPVAPGDAWPDDMVLAEGIDRYEQAVTAPVTRVERSWAGLRTFSPDGTPAAGFAPEAEGFLWLAGQGGYGIQTAPALSRLAADLALGRKPTGALPPETIKALSPDRFSASRA